MELLTIFSRNFRNLHETTCQFESGLNIFYGDNAQGKTNLLESIYLCSTGRSMRGAIDKEMIKFGENEAQVKIVLNNNDCIKEIAVHLRKNDKKTASIDFVALKKLGDLFGHLLTVVFSPEDLELVKGMPSIRRRFMDIELCQLNPVYYYELQQYYKVMKQRNHLLKTIQKKLDDKSTLSIWDAKLIEHGSRIISYRLDFLEKLHLIASVIHQTITQQKEILSIVYLPSVNLNKWEEVIQHNRERDIANGNTSFGIHKDDFNFYINNISAREFSSQGQQRTISLSVKLAEVQLIKKIKKKSPVLLLDDVFSELDLQRQKYFLETLQDIQVVITCADLNSVISSLPSDINTISVVNGYILS